MSFSEKLSIEYLWDRVQSDLLEPIMVVSAGDESWRKRFDHAVNATINIFSMYRPHEESINITGVLSEKRYEIPRKNLDIFDVVMPRATTGATTTENPFVLENSALRGQLASGSLSDLVTYSLEQNYYDDVLNLTGSREVWEVIRGKGSASDYLYVHPAPSVAGDIICWYKRKIAKVEEIEYDWFHWFENYLIAKMKEMVGLRLISIAASSGEAGSLDYNGTQLRDEGRDDITVLTDEIKANAKFTQARQF